MKCQKCGAKLHSGHLYCDICGAEYQVVPDFEPEIENSIAQSLSDISETVEKNTPDPEKEPGLDEQRIKSPSFILILLIVAVCFVFGAGGYLKYTNSVRYQSSQAVNAVNSGEYLKAVRIYEKLRKEHPEEAVWYIKEAENRLILKKYEEAYELAAAALNLEENAGKENAYEILLQCLKQKRDYIEMNRVLKGCEFTAVKEKYWEYLCEIPAINYESGSYDTSLELAFEKGFQGTVYYSLDDVQGEEQYLKYERPIKIENGTHTLKVIYENPYGLKSEPEIMEYRILSEIPMAPEAEPASGTYRYARMITVNVEENTRVYYTTDQTTPTRESREYTEPIPMPLGESRFNFIDVSEQGVYGKVTQRNYMLNIKTNVSVEEAETLLMQKLISSGHILDQNGAVQDRYGVFRYFYKFPIAETEQNYYVFEEHYLENQINNPLGHFYAVDVLYGEVYKLIREDNGNFIRAEI